MYLEPIPNAAQLFAKSLNQARAANAATIQPLMQQGQTADPKSFAALENILIKLGM
jgi:hypothetical protein